MVLIGMTEPQCHRSDIVLGKQQWRCAVPSQGHEILNEHHLMRAFLSGQDREFLVGRGGAYAPPLPNCQTGIPSLRALSARLSWMPVP
ncbi:MAG: hypothetical protein E6614_36400, partial [Bradyrhizobium sp.]|nr:hypothetical protein [Bradyrhizobium sp.]